VRDAYLDRAHLEMLLTYNLDKPSGTLEAGALATCVYKLLMTARSEGWLHDLVNAAIEDRPQNAQLKAWVNSIDRPTHYWHRQHQAAAFDHGIERLPA
jgi:hypothetical protein